jgi:hypothetical protein
VYSITAATGVILDLDPGGMRKLHRHPNADRQQERPRTNDRHAPRIMTRAFHLDAVSSAPSSTLSGVFRRPARFLQLLNRAEF